MSVIPVTLFFSLLLATTFVVLFAREHRHRGLASAERDSLLPLADEAPRVASAVASRHHPSNAPADAPDRLTPSTLAPAPGRDRARAFQPAGHP